MNILNNLTIKHLKMNKKRTIVTIIGVILSTALMVGIGLLLSTFREMTIDETISHSGDYHVSFNQVPKEKINIIKNNSNVKSIHYRGFIGYSKEEKITNTHSPYLVLFKTNQDYLKNLNLIDGKIPQNNSEIVVPNHIDGFNYKIGDIVNLKLGKRYFEGVLKDDYYLEADEYINVELEKTYKIVGIISRDVYEKSGDPGYYAYTYDDDILNYEVYVKFKKPSKTYNLADTMARTIYLSNEEVLENVRYNDALLSMYGASRYDNFISGMSGLLAIMLSLVSIGCIIVIYNSFAISVMERKKQFGLFASIGATKKQIRKTVLFESFIVGLIGIPLGILSSYVGIGTVIIIMNQLLKDIVDVTFKLTTYPIFIIIPIIFMIISILISAFLPARKASKISPIEAIRLNDDIKIKGKKVKTFKFIRKIFGLEGELALKNIKRNKKKYRITIVSLFISIVLFISFSSYMQYMVTSIGNYVEVPDYQLILSNVNNIDKNILNDIKNSKYVDDSIIMSIHREETTTDLGSMYTKKYKEFLDKQGIVSFNELNFFIVDDNKFESYIKDIGLHDLKPVLYSKYKGIIYTANSRKSYEYNKYDLNKDIKRIDICRSEYIEELTEVKYNCDKSITNYYVSNHDILGIDEMSTSQGPLFIVSESYIKELLNIETSLSLIIKTNKTKELDKIINDYIENDKLNKRDYYNIEASFQMLNNVILMVNILVYGFISLVTLIGVTSVFNTINTSIALRRKEFAVLRSIGLTPKGFNKMLRFESLFYGLKSIIYALPVSLLITFLIHSQTSEFVVSEYILIPWIPILIAILGVFIIIIITMTYSTKKIKNENIIDTIREENI